jgi:hypothetical protein
MKNNIPKKFLLVQIFIFIFVLSITCNKDYPIAPSFDVRIIVRDSSNSISKIYNGNIPDAVVILKDNEIGKELLGRTDSNGVAIISMVQTGYYDIIVSRKVSETEMFKATGNKIEAVLNGQKVNQFLDKNTTNYEISINIAQLGTIIFSEIYYNGAKAPPSSYFMDQYTELYNNTDSIRYVDGLIIANVYKGFVNDKEFAHSRIVWQFPGSGNQYPIKPGGFIIVAQDAIDHRQSHPNSIDLSSADFEYYNERPDNKDIDNPDVKNMIRILMNTQFDWNYSVMSDALILARIPDVNTLNRDSQGNLLIPISSIIDGVEWISDRDLQQKRLSPLIDMSCTGGMPIYTGKSIERKILRKTGNRAILMDNNNSALDFDTIPVPTLRALH